MDGAYPKISIIIPVYNAKAYLEECVKSVLNQIFTDFELILVDDGSDDGSNLICDQYAVNDSRVKSFHKKNGGVSSARNLGLDNAKGEWITFIDSDDYVDPYYLEHLVVHADGRNDLIVAYSKLISSSSTIVDPPVYPDIQINQSNFQSLFAKYDLDVYTTCWSKLYKKSFLNEFAIRFPEKLVLGEDHVFLYTCILKTYNIYITHYSDYYYRDTPNSLSKNFRSHEVEYVGYKYFNAIINEMIIQKHISNDVVLYKLKAIIAHYVWRVLGSLYMYQTPRDIRLSIIRSLDLSVVYYVKDNTRNAKILKFLLRYNLICLYDFLKIKSRQYKLMLSHL